MIETEAMIREGMHALVGASPVVDVPPPDVIAQRASTGARARRRAPSRARRSAALAMIGLVGTAGVAAATGNLPGPVERTLHEFDSWGFRTTGDAELMATLKSGATTYEIWRAPLATGGECVYERKTGPGGDVEHGGSSACTGDPTDESSATIYPGAYPERTGAENTAWGQLPIGGVAAVFALGDGSTYRVAAQHDRYFLTTFAGVPAGTLVLGDVQVERADGSLSPG